MTNKSLKLKILGIFLTGIIILSTLSLFLIIVLKGYELNLGFSRIKINNPLSWLITILLVSSFAYWLLKTDKIDTKKNPILLLLKKADLYHLLLMGIFMVCLYYFYYQGGRLGSDGVIFFRWVRSFIYSGHLDPRTSEPFNFRLVHLTGPTLLWFPFFLIAHIIAWVANLCGRSIPLDGSSYPYVNAICLSSLLYAFAGIILIYELLKNYFTKLISFISVTALWLGTFLLWYMIYQPSMAQCASLFSVSLFIYVWFKSWAKRNLKGWLWLLMLSILMIAIRPYNVIFLLFPLIEIIEEKIKLLKQKKWILMKSSLKRDAIVLIATAASIFSVFYLIRGWYIIRTSGIFHWTQPKIVELLFSSHHGLLSWTPLIYVSLLGLPFIFKKDKRLFLYCLITIIVLIYVLSSIADWFAGDSYGSRRFMGSLFIFSLALAAFIERIKKHPYILIGIIIGCFLMGNILFIEQFRKGRVPRNDTISFKRAAQEEISSFYSRFGHPFSFPANLWFRFKYGTPMENFDRIFGHRAYHNIYIDIGNPDDELFLGEGWYGSESFEGAFSFRWSKGKESSLLVSLLEAYNYRVELMTTPLSYPNSPQQVITIYVNGQKASIIRLKSGFNTYSITIPKNYWKAGLNEIRFKYAFYHRPKSVMKSSDERYLAAAFNYIKLQIIK